METRDADALCGAGDLDVEPAASREREFVLGNLVALGKVGIEIIFAGETRTLVHGAVQGERGAHGHFDRALVEHGSVPGRPRHTGQTLLFGGSPKRVEQPQKILVLLSSWTWTSRPITGSYFAKISGDTDASSGTDFAIKNDTL